jgi:hypothetical protein
MIQSRGNRKTRHNNGEVKMYDRSDFMKLPWGLDSKHEREFVLEP